MELLGRLEGKSIAVVASNPRYYHRVFDADFVFRFNQDPSEQVSVWCTSFWPLGYINEVAERACEAVLSTIPRGSVRLPSYDKDFEPQIERSMPQLRKPVGFVSTKDWIQMFEKCGGPPLSGLLVCEILRSSSMKRCTLYGFDFYRKQVSFWRQTNGIIGDVHQVLPSINCLKSMLRDDPRLYIDSRWALRIAEFKWRVNHEVDRLRAKKEGLRKKSPTSY